MKIVNHCRKIIKNHEKKEISKNMRKHDLWIFVLSPWINVWAAKSFSRWTKLIDHEEISSKTCSECFSDSYSPPEFQFYKTPVFIAFLIFSEIYFFINFIIIFMIFVHFSAIICCFHDYFATWSKYFATWYLFRGSGALPVDVVQLDAVSSVG